MTNHALTAALAAASLLLSAPAFAQNTVTEQTILEACASGLSSADFNRDGWVTPVEADAAFEGNFSLLDGDGDGAVTLREFQNCRAGSGLRTERKAEMREGHPFYRGAGDADGNLDRTTWLGIAQEQLAKVPMIDGAANPYVYDAIMQGFSLPAEAIDSNGNSLVEPGEAHLGIQAGFTGADADRDGRISAAEHATRDVTTEVIDVDASLQARLSERWRAMDTDSDAQVTLEEYRAAGMKRYEAAAASAESDPEVAVPVVTLMEMPDS
jgi:Ca2+-binding EF-hand superfamily protein